MRQQEYIIETISRRRFLTLALVSLAGASCKQRPLPDMPTATQASPTPPSASPDPLPAVPASPTLTTTAAPPTQTPIPEHVIAVSAGGQHSMALTADSRVWTWGRDDNGGQLGDGQSRRGTRLALPSRIPMLHEQAMISAGGAFSLSLGSDGNLWAWGRNPYGQLGIGTTKNESTPVQVPIDAELIDIAAGGVHALGLDAEGQVWGWGNNELGSTGVAAPEHQLRPVIVPDFDRVIAVATGGQSMALRDDGTVWVWGAAQFSGMEDWNRRELNIPVQLPELEDIIAIANGNGRGMALTANGRVWTWEYGRSQKRPSEMPGLSGIVSISMSGNHWLCLDQEGQVWAWGENDTGQLGDGLAGHDFGRLEPAPVVSLEDIAAISAGFGYNLVLTADGRVWAWGENLFGQLGDGSTETSPLPIQIETFRS